MQTDLSLRRHYENLAEAAKVIYEIQQCLRSYREDEVFNVVENPPGSGLWCLSPLPEKMPLLTTFAGAVAPVDRPEAECLFYHLSQEFSSLTSRKWTDLIENEISMAVVDRLRYLGNTARFTYCPHCQVCKDLVD